MRGTEPAPRVALTRRYVAALAVLAALIVAGAAVVDSSIRDLGGNARIVDVVGRQRSLRHQVSKNALQVRYATSREELAGARADLNEVIAQLRRNRALLADSATGALRDRARRWGTTRQAEFDSLLAGVAILANPASAPDSIRWVADRIVAAEPRAVAILDSALSTLTAASAERVEMARREMHTVVALVLIGLIGVGILILRPAVLGIRAALAHMQATNAELDLALAEAKGVATAKSEFLATMSHELRTPLNAVIGLSGLLSETDLDERQRKFVSTVNHSGEALLGLINNILDLSKIEAGGLELELLDFDLRELVETTAETLALRAEGRNVELATYVAQDVPWTVRGDSGRIRQVLLNLIGNALKFTERGSVVVRVRTGGGDRVRFDVSDTGIGIPPDRLGRLFKAFSQVDASTTRRFGGTGLGLDISRRLVEVMGGSIGVESRVGKGSTFFFEVPLAPVNSEATGTFRAVEHSLRNRRVLIVDDTEANRILLRETLAGWGMVPFEAATPHTALSELRTAAARGAPFDVVIADWQMPELDGYGFASEVRRDPVIAATPLVLLSSFAHRGDAEAERVAQFAATLAKPVRQRPLMDAIATALRGQVPSHTSASATLASVVKRWPGRRVLVADDNPVNVLVLKSMVEAHGIRVDVAADGGEVGEAWGRTEYHLILMDVYMPGIDGPTATRTIRERERAAGRSRVPIVACTASVTQDDRAACVAAGMDDYVSKPVARDVLDATLRRWLGEPAP